MTSHYLDCRLTVEPDDYSFMFARLYKVAHGIIGNNSARNIGLSFPEYDDGRLGEILRFFADEKTLNSVKQNIGLIVLQDCQIIRISDIKQTPEQHQSVCFYRNRLNERLSAKNQSKRYQSLKRHIESKGEVFNIEGRQQRQEKLQQQANSKAQYIQLQSSSNNFNYSLRINKSESVERKEGPYNSYGLGGKDIGTTVPFGF
ncbi:MAG: type I-F CRISPR-associated endoribonuclease Cas6/Csy4 [Gammaproteobacteria bacterium]